MAYFEKTLGNFGKPVLPNEGVTDLPSWATTVSPKRRMDRSDNLNPTKFHRSYMGTVDFI